MSMEVTSTYGGYAIETYNSAIKKNTVAKSDDSANSVEEYYEKLCKKFPDITFNKSSGLASGNENKVVLNLSNECLKKMASDPEFEKKVEFNLTGVVQGQNWLYAKAKADGAVIHGVTAVMDADGNVSVTCGGMTRTSGSKQNSGLLNTGRQIKERLEKKREEEKELERLREKRKAKEEYLDRMQEKRREESEEYISEQQEKGNLTTRAYTQTGYDIADSISTIDKQI